MQFCCLLKFFCAKGGFMKIVMQVGCWAGWLASATGVDSRLALSRKAYYILVLF
jgi:hypothetical protein